MKQLPYGVQTPKDIVKPALTWCQEQWGPRLEPAGNHEGTWTVFWCGGSIDPPHYQWWFETEQQQIMFTLRWQR